MGRLFPLALSSLSAPATAVSNLGDCPPGQVPALTPLAEPEATWATRKIPSMRTALASLLRCTMRQRARFLLPPTESRAGRSALTLSEPSLFYAQLEAASLSDAEF
jgi:hypothetical protein